VKDTRRRGASKVEVLFVLVLLSPIPLFTISGQLSAVSKSAQKAVANAAASQATQGQDPMTGSYQGKVGVVSFDLEGAKFEGTNTTSFEGFYRYYFIATPDHGLTLSATTSASPLTNKTGAEYSISLENETTYYAGNVAGNNPISTRIRGSNPAMSIAQPLDPTTGTEEQGFRLDYWANNSRANNGNGEYTVKSLIFTVLEIPIVTLQSNATGDLRVPQISQYGWKNESVVFHGRLLPAQVNWPELVVLANGTAYDYIGKIGETDTVVHLSQCGGPYNDPCPDWHTGYFSFNITFGEYAYYYRTGPTRYSVFVNYTSYGFPREWISQFNLDPSVAVSQSPAIDFSVEYASQSSTTVTTTSATIYPFGYPMEIYPTQPNYTSIELSYGGQSPNSPIQISVVKDSTYPPALQVSFSLSKTGDYTSTLDASPSSSGITDVYINFTLNCAEALCSQSSGLVLPKNYTLTVTASSGSYSESHTILIEMLKSKWLVMFYLVGNTNDPPLEKQQLYNVEEMINDSENSRTPQVGVYILLNLFYKAPGSYWVLFGGKVLAYPIVRPTKELWGISSIPDSETLLYQVVDGRLKPIGGAWSPPNSMSDPATLHRFLSTVMAMVPADRNQLIFSDHGGGIDGIGPNLWPSQAMLTVPGITAAMQGISPKLEIITFDACLMAQIEVLYNLRNYANYFTASEIPVPGLGSAYNVFLAQLEANPSMPTVDYLRLMVKSAGDRYAGIQEVAGHPVWDNVTMSAVDASKLEAVNTSLQYLAKALLIGYSAHSVNYNLTVRLCATSALSTRPDREYVDIYDFAKCLTNDFVQGSAENIFATKVTAAVNAAVIANVSHYNKRLTKLVIPTSYYGLSVVLPAGPITNGLSNRYENLEGATDFGGSSGSAWFPFVIAYQDSVRIWQDMVSVTLTHPGQELFLSVSDPAGRHVGVNQSLADFSRTALDVQIKGASYFDFENGTSVILVPRNVSSFRLQVDGGTMQEAQESFTVTLVTYAGGAVGSTKTVSATMARGSLATTMVTTEGGVISAGDFTITAPPTVPSNPSSSQPLALLGSSLTTELAVVIVLLVVLVVAFLALRRRGSRARARKVEPLPPVASAPSPVTEPKPVERGPATYRPEAPRQPPQPLTQRPHLRYCTNCGTVVVEGQTFCTNCGTVVQ
jgi:hypothetical protein